MSATMPDAIAEPSVNSVTRALLHQLVDYAGLFPPAALSLETVVHNYHRYRQSSARFALARLIVPTSQLADLARIAQPFWSGRNTADHLWQISALVASPETHSADFESGMQAIAEFNQAHCGAAQVDALETKAGLAETITRWGPAIPAAIQTYWELPHAQNIDEPLLAIQALGADQHRAKIRTGGIKSELIPPVEQVARFITSCAAHRVPFKATAGLHHPLRSSFPLTYEANAPCGVMHGYLNVFLAATVAWHHRVAATELEPLLDFSRPAGHSAQGMGLQLESENISIGRWTLSANMIATARQAFAVAFGSCSFTEPINELIELGMLNNEYRIS
jgi:hypothetical protein